MFILHLKHSVANHFIAEMRDAQIQRDSMRFRRNLERVGEILAYEISKTFNYYSVEIVTPLGVSTNHLIEKQPVLATILRAGLPFHQGFLNYFDKAENAFIGSYRGKPDEEQHFEIVQEYITAPNLEGKTLILTDPMLATGKSFIAAYKALEKFGTPKYFHIATVIASKVGVEHVRTYFEKIFGKRFFIWIGALDNMLNSKSYIVPGLGDAGDLAFGSKQ
ncbi:MAG: uracil phosphoribosyltransferase [Microscillaceae bacterium]|nr:uracil phosphoribosyltransferase [Microscillaceae bacterium]MDW8461123.1 uracil phosphoribosyltransferase [Cytophagales bacterium]